MLGINKSITEPQRDPYIKGLSEFLPCMFSSVNNITAKIQHHLNYLLSIYLSIYSFFYLSRVKGNLLREYNLQNFVCKWWENLYFRVGITELMGMSGMMNRKHELIYVYLSICPPKLVTFAILQPGWNSLEVIIKAGVCSCFSR